MNNAADYFRLYAAYLRDVNPTDRRSVPDFGSFMRAWDQGAIAVRLLYADTTAVGFMTAFRIRGVIMGQLDSWSFGACYTEPEHRTVYKLTLFAGKQFADELKLTGAERVIINLPAAEATRLKRLAAAAVAEYSRGFVL
jgi:hypothetical protein